MLPILSLTAGLVTVFCIKPKTVASLRFPCKMSNDDASGSTVPCVVRDELPTVNPSSTSVYGHQVRHLVVHFDINETILLGDDAGGDTREDALNKMLAKSAFVQMPSHTVDATKEDDAAETCYESTSELVPTRWWNGELIDTTATNSCFSPPPLYTKWHWPKGCCPYYRTSYKKRSKTFVEHHGKIYQSLHDLLQTKLAQDHLHATHPVLPHILPAFFDTLQVLSQQQQQNESPSLTIVLRTMGTDLPDVAQAISLFATGKHPDYPDFDNKALVLTPQQLYRGQWTREPPHVYQLWQADQLVASGDSEVVHLLQSQTICGIQDDYAFWHAHAYAPWSGKPVWIPSDPSVHHVLLDDNIHNLPHDGIASVRRQLANDCWETLSSADILKQHGKHLIRTPTIEPVLNPHWFLERIQYAVNQAQQQDAKEE